MTKACVCHYVIHLYGACNRVCVCVSVKSSPGFEKYNYQWVGEKQIEKGKSVKQRVADEEGMISCLSQFKNTYFYRKSLE